MDDDRVLALAGDFQRRLEALRHMVRALATAFAVVVVVVSAAAFSIMFVHGKAP
ncbi:hypothetical protein DDE01_28240 [Desulfovibrio desulfuricans]|nr:hypothetical protein DDE01_28240 [Desulfovibrio desulfuricans]